MGRRQLYRVLESIDVPEIVRTGFGSQTKARMYRRVPLVHWPDGTPCISLNAYLLEQKILTTGDSVVTYAAELSQLVRFCGSNGIGFDCLDDSALWRWSVELQSEMSKHHPTERARNRNTVRRIIEHALRFLLWHQNTFGVPGETPLIGEARVSPRIKIALKTNPHSGRTYAFHPCLPASDSREPKSALSREMIEAIETTVEDLSQIEKMHWAAKRRYSRNPELLAAVTEYLRERRRFTLFMFKRTGMRPDELVHTSLEQNENILANLALTLPTRKTRQRDEPTRRFGVTLKDALRWLRYVTVRKGFVDALKHHNPSYRASQSLLLTQNGQPLKRGSLLREFSRLAKRAGFQNVQVCLSMFRHRFITYEVVVHLREFMVTSGKDRHSMTAFDYRCILRRVIAKTGHRSIDSLWHYIDLAWAELNVWGTIDKALERLNAADRLFEDLLALETDSSGPGADRKLSLETVQKRLSEIVHQGKRDLLTAI